MASKNVIIKRKIADEIFELLPKTSGAQVEVTYGTEVKALADVLSTVYTDLEAWNTFKKDVDFAGTDSALDTLRELIDYLSQEDVATSIAGQLSAIKDRLDAVEAKAAANETAIGELTQTVAANKKAAEDAVTALTQTVTDNKTAADATEAKAEQNKTDIAALTQTVAANKTAAEEAIAAVDAKAVKNAEDIAANKTAAEEAVAAVDAKAVKNAEDIAVLQGVAAAQARVIVAEEIPADLSETDLMLQIV